MSASAYNNDTEDLMVVVFTKEMLECLFDEHHLGDFAKETKLCDALAGEKVYLGVEMALRLAMYDYEEMQSERGITGLFNIDLAKKSLGLFRDTLMPMFGKNEGVFRAQAHPF